jgi:hypothetical protein
MGLLTDFFVAPRALAGTLLDGSKTEGLPQLLLKGLDPVKLETLRAALAKHRRRKLKKEDLTLMTDEAAEQWVFLVPSSLVELLVEVGDQSAAVAAAWIKTDELKADRWTASVAAEIIAQLAALAAEAKAQKQDLLLRMSV